MPTADHESDAKSAITGESSSCRKMTAKMAAVAVSWKSLNFMRRTTWP